VILNSLRKQRILKIEKNVKHFFLIFHCTFIDMFCVRIFFVVFFDIFLCSLFLFIFTFFTFHLIFFFFLFTLHLQQSACYSVFLLWISNLIFHLSVSNCHRIFGALQYREKYFFYFSTSYTHRHRLFKFLLSYAHSGTLYNLDNTSISISTWHYTNIHSMCCWWWWFWFEDSYFLWANRNS